MSEGRGNAPNTPKGIKDLTTGKVIPEDRSPVGGWKPLAGIPVLEPSPPTFPSPGEVDSAPLQSSEPPQPQRGGRISRRTVLKAAIAAAAGKQVGNFLWEVLSYPSNLNVKDRFEKFGIGHFFETYEGYRNLDYVFHYIPPRGNGDGDSLHKKLFWLGGDSPRVHWGYVQYLTENWGTKSQEAEKAALDKIAKLSIDTTQTTDDPNRVRAELTKVAKLLPALFLAGPDKFVIQPAGQHFVGYYFENDISIPSPQNLEIFMRTLIHELTHAMDRVDLDQVKGYLRAHLFADYMATKLRALYNLTTSYFMSDSKTALRFKDNGLLLNDPREVTTRTQMISHLNKLGAEDIVRTSAQITQSGHELYNLLIHGVGKRYLQVFSKPPNQRTAHEKALINDEQVISWIKSVASEFDHYLVGPEWRVQTTPGLLREANLDVHKARMKVFSRGNRVLEPDDLRRELGLPIK